VKAEATSSEPPTHKCYKNWEDTSTAMESDIILEGFRQSINMHNLIYHKLIGDGDSSATKKLQMFDKKDRVQKPHFAKLSKQT